jgi:hypothetical protein
MLTAYNELKSWPYRSKATKVKLGIERLESKTDVCFPALVWIQVMNQDLYDESVQLFK